MAAPRILIVVDNPLNLEMARFVLVADGVQVAAVADDIAKELAK